MKSLKKTILASALAVTLVGGIFASKASAADDPQLAKPATESQIGDAKQLKITKILSKVEKGVTTPNEKFTFRFTPYDENDPAIPDVEIPFTSDDNTDAYPDEDGIQVEKFKVVELSNINWTRTGEHIYKLEEVVPDTHTKDMKYGLTEDYNGSGFKKPARELDVRIYVEEDENGELKATKYTVNVSMPKRYGKIEIGPKGIKFKNNYDKKDGNENPGGGTEITDADKKGFAFKKVVDSKKQEDLQKSFDFGVKVDKAIGSNLNNKTEVVKYYVIDENGNRGEEKTAAYGTEFTVSLKHNERVVFSDVILGSKVSVTEKDSKALTPSVRSEFFEKDTNVSNNKTAVGYIGDQEGGNYVEFTNKNVPLTGVLIDNLPYIALVAVAGLGIFFFIKNRREEEIYA